MKQPELPPMLQREWDRQEKALLDEKAGVGTAKLSGADVTYRMVERALRMPLDRELDRDFSARTAVRAQSAVPSLLIRPGAVETTLLYGAVALMGISLILVMWNLIADRGLRAPPALLAVLTEPWIGVAAACTLCWWFIFPRRLVS